MKYEKTVLYVEDDNDTLTVYEDFLKRRFEKVVTATNGDEAYRKYIENNPDLIITDIRLPSQNGIELITNIRKKDKKIPIIVISAYTEEPFIVNNIEKNVNYFFQKPVEREKLSFALKHIFEEENENTFLHNTIEKVEKAYIKKEKDDLIIVGVGASAGGLEALSSMVKNLPQKNNTAYIIAQHLSPTHKTLLADLLARETKVYIKDAVNLETLQPDTIYITPPNKNVEINEQNQIVLYEPNQNSFLPKPSVNQLFISIAKHKKDKSIGIILSGTGTDGTQGLRAINSEGGITIVQEPKSAKYDGMPVSAINGCVVDIVLNPENIGKELLELTNFPREKVLHKNIEILTQNDLGSIFSALYKKFKVDFSIYKSSTINRRIERRMAARKITSISKYSKFVKTNPDELELLYKDILIGVTSFFRDEQVFESLKYYITDYVEKTQTNKIRIWTPGCSTGEEAYSILIILEEICEEKDLALEINLFATDIDKDALMCARKGIYSEANVSNLSNTIIKKYFRVKNDQFEVKKNLKTNVIFSHHNLLSDPPFKNIDLIVCRNLLIYFDVQAQKHIMPLFYYSLNENGLLVLGKSENATNFENIFSPIDKKNKIFKRLLSSTTAKIFPSNLSTPKFMDSNIKEENPVLTLPKSSLQETIIKEAVNYLSPNMIITNEQMEIIYKKGKCNFLNFPEGFISYNIFKLVSPNLSLELRKTINQVKKDKKTYSTRFIPNNDKYLKVIVIPFFDNPNDLFLLYFQEIEKDEFPLIDVNDSFEKNQESLALELELKYTKEHLQTLVEELETSNEELQSTNEELQSSNEELQSTNEELETSNEELQSTNEELQTAYSELKSTYEEISKIKDGYAILNRRYDSLLDNVSDAIIVTNVDGMFIKVNDVISQLTKWPKETLLTKTWEELIVDSSSIEFSKQKETLFIDGNFGPIDIKVLTYEKSTIVLRVTSFMTKDDDAKIQIWNFCKEVTNEYNISNQLSIYENMLNLLYKKSNLAIVKTNLENIIENVNNKFEELIEIKNYELKNKNLNHFVVIENLNDNIDIDYFEKHDEYITQKVFQTKSNKRVKCEINLSIIKDCDNKPQNYLYIIKILA